MLMAIKSVVDVAAVIGIVIGGAYVCDGGITTTPCVPALMAAAVYTVCTIGATFAYASARRS